MNNKELKSIVQGCGIRHSELSESDRTAMITEASEAYAKFMDSILGDKWRRDPQSVDTPNRVSRMFINELLAGQNNELPKITSFPNDGSYTGMVFQGDIDVKSLCSHHHMPFFGKAYVAYIPSADGKIVGLSKLNRIVEFCSRRTSVQETLTRQIANMVDRLTEKNKGVAVHIVANHTCVSHRGVNQSSTMKTANLTGLFFSNEIGTRDEFLANVSDLRNGK